MAYPKINELALTPEQATFVESCVDSGRYQSASEVIGSSLQLLKDQETRRGAEIQRIRSSIQQGADQLDRGETVEGDELFRRWKEKHENLSNQAGSE